MADEQLLARIDGLLLEGEDIISTATRARNEEALADIEKFHHWRSQADSLLTRILGEQDHYAKEFLELTGSRRLGPIRGGQGVLRALRDDVANGYLARFTALITAEVFADFLDMAAHLLSNHYLHPAASLIGAVLEDGLRRIAAGKGIIVKHPGTLSTLNDALSQGNVYSKIQWRQIQVWGDIRNTVDHGHFDTALTEEQVKDMHRGVSGFLAEHLR